MCKWFHNARDVIIYTSCIMKYSVSFIPFSFVKYNIMSKYWIGNNGTILNIRLDEDKNKLLIGVKKKERREIKV